MAILLNPVAPHVTSELYEIVTGGEKIEKASWPKYDPAKLIDDSVEIPVQVMGKLKGRVTVNRGASQEDVMAKVNEQGILNGLNVIKVIYVKDKIINIVAK